MNPLRPPPQFDYTDEDRAKARTLHRERTYGLTPRAFDELLARQGGVCAICSRVRVRWVVDHCHRTDVVRGILCYSCNTSLGKMQDSPALLRRAAEYLETHGSGSDSLGRP